MKSLIILIILLITTSIDAKELADLKNLVIHKTPKTYENIAFSDSKGQIIELSKLKGKLIILNFWATWCAPCKKEMPSLDKLSIKYSDILIFPINLEKPNPKKSKEFFDNLKIKNLSIYFDPDFKLTKQFQLRGIPTTILINKEGKEFARIIGEIDFNDKKFVEWLRQFI